MKTTAAASLTLATALAAQAQTENFDQTKVGALPDGWECGVTGTGNPRWAVNADPTAPSKPHVLHQAGSGTFPWCVKNDVALADGFVEVRFKALAGKEDQAGGVVWRWKDGNNYYVARANALENNVSLYYTANGRRSTLAAMRIRVALNGKVYIELDDKRIKGPGRRRAMDQGRQRHVLRRLQLRFSLRRAPGIRNEKGPAETGPLGGEKVVRP